MNETIEVIKRRRSIRKFKPKQIPDEYLQEILECAILAPNARNQQKWHFIVIQNKETLDKMGEHNGGGHAKIWHRLSGAEGERPKLQPLLERPNSDTNHRG